MPQCFVQVTTGITCFFPVFNQGPTILSSDDGGFVLRIMLLQGSISSPSAEAHHYTKLAAFSTPVHLASFIGLTAMENRGALSYLGPAFVLFSFGDILRNGCAGCPTIGKMEMTCSVMVRDLQTSSQKPMEIFTERLVGQGDSPDLIHDLRGSLPRVPSQILW